MLELLNWYRYFRMSTITKPKYFYIAKHLGLSTMHDCETTIQRKIGGHCASDSPSRSGAEPAALTLKTLVTEAYQALQQFQIFKSGFHSRSYFYFYIDFMHRDRLSKIPLLCAVFRICNSGATQLMFPQWTLKVRSELRFF